MSASTTVRRRRPIRHPRRRGIVLLVIISLLVLFMLMLVTFAVVASHYREAARAFNRRTTVEEQGRDPELDGILFQLLAEPASPASSLWGHSLLADLYGKSVRGVVAFDPNNPTVAPPPASEGSGALVAFCAVVDQQQAIGSAAFSNVEGYHVGCVLTFIDGPLAGRSTRITHYGPGDVNNSPPNPAIPNSMEPGATITDPLIFRIEGFGDSTLLPQPGNHFIVNGKPFNGLGLGRDEYDRAYPNNPEYRNDGLVDVFGTPGDTAALRADDLPAALLPVLTNWRYRSSAAHAMSSGMNEAYDTYDQQNMALAFVPTDTFGPPNILPSFHRQDLINYWYQRLQAQNPPMDLFDANSEPMKNLLRHIMFRPRGGPNTDHPQFTGSNPGFRAIPDVTINANPWDVDNDGDGIADSIWIDPGLPVETAPDGRKYKRLVALQIRDLDNRVNANAHGNTEYIKNLNDPNSHYAQATIPARGPLAGNAVNTAVPVPRGLGYGPAEINFLNLFPPRDYAQDGDVDGADTDGDPATPADADDPSDQRVRFAIYRRVLQGTDGDGAGIDAIPGRYGLDNSIFLPPTNNANANRRPGYPGPTNAFGPSNDMLSIIKMQGFGGLYAGTNFSNNASPPDVWGRGALALDYAGQPFTFSDYTPAAPYEQAMSQPVDWLRDGTHDGTQQTSDINDNPYEINLVDPQASSDTPYTVAEFEAVLRRNETDLPYLASRLYAALQPSFPADFDRRANIITTLSSHIPSPRASVPYYMRGDAAARAEYGLRPDGRVANARPVAGTILDVALARIQRDVRFTQAIAIDTPGPTESVKQTILKQLMPFEFFHGQMFDLNRPFGNGEDDAFDGTDNDNDGMVDEPGEAPGNGVVDEPGETDHLNGRFEHAWSAGPFSGAAVGQPRAFPLNDARANWWTPPDAMTFPEQNAPAYLNFLDGDPHLYARQLYARNLYCLLLLFCDPSYNGDYHNEAMLTDAVQQRKLLCKRLAQFAVNVVDYRDPDAIMTPFEYDENPFDGWHVDGFIAPRPHPADPMRVLPGNENDTFDNGNANPDGWLPGQLRQVVWGMEFPELQLTESLGMHNRGVKDTNIDDGADGEPQKKTTDGTPDKDFDQYRIPQGSLFLEFFCPRNSATNNPKLPLELYDPSGSLDLGRLAPAGPVMTMREGIRHPVWRAVITLNPDDAGTPKSVHDYAAEHPNTAVMDPGNLQVDAERIIWFSPLDPAGTPEADRVFYERTGTLPNIASIPFNEPARSDVLLAPGHYVVAAPRPHTTLGSLTTNMPSPLEFSVDTGTFSPLGGTSPPNNGFTPYSTAGIPMRPVRGIVCAAKPPSGWMDQTRQVGMNISEPLPNQPTGTYYDEPDPMADTYGDPLQPYVPTDNDLPDVPFDERMNFGPLDADADKVKTGTREDFRSVFVQRLANPLLPWNPSPEDPEFGAQFDVQLAINPYLTTDWNTLDLTVFSGEDNTDDPKDPTPFSSDPREKFAGRERGFGDPTAGDPPDLRFWRNVVNVDLPFTDAPVPAPVPGTPEGDSYFYRKPRHTLGYLNSTMGTPDPAPVAGYEGFPVGGFPWLTWNNRLFANPHELLLVPACVPNRLGLEYEFRNSVRNENPYVPPGGMIPANERYNGHFGHLLQFFLTSDPSGMTPRVSQDCYRLFDYVETPSPFVGTERWYQPAELNDNPATPQLDPPAFGITYRAPFNKLSRFRDPGRININTLHDPEVWNALHSSYPEMQQAPRPTAGAALPNGPFAAVIRSRRGYNDTSNEIGEPDNAFPSIFSNPFRPADAHDLMPLTAMRNPLPIDASLLRLPNAPTATTPLLNDMPIGSPIAYPIYDPATGSLGMSTSGPVQGQATPQNSFRATDRNPFFRYQPYTKLSNLITTTSNTYAVWMTVGYFEVVPNPGGVDAAHPDGYQLGQELQQLDGTFKRPKAFYIIDRSIPVAFEPGQIHNVDQCVLQRRYRE